MSDPHRRWGRRSALPHTAGYVLCPHCWRAVPARLDERYCVNDGTRLLSACATCGRAIASPYARYCPGCGQPYGALHPDASLSPQSTLRRQP
ncbi:zinc ribbon domain-containing protein [Deinococcus sp. KSM4-11]|uniref:double zinc ribbon domain-containing protein n=1 Tax=Deinococcus sp. KSM4-11 TaxID=2568654 RepID=UPI001454B899